MGGGLCCAVMWCALSWCGVVFRAALWRATTPPAGEAQRAVSLCGVLPCAVLCCKALYGAVWWRVQHAAQRLLCQSLNLLCCNAACCSVL
jgi:hypothetical protein